MKKYLCIMISFVFSIICFEGCSNDNNFLSYNSDQYVILSDYESFQINKKKTVISKEEISYIVYNELSVNEAYIEITDRNKIEENDIVKALIDNEEIYIQSNGKMFGKDFDYELLNMKKGDRKRIEIEEKGLCNVEVIGIYRNATIKDEEFLKQYYKCSTFEGVIDFLKKRAYNEIVYNYAYEKICESSSIIEYPEEIKTQMDKEKIENTDKILETYTDMDSYLKENNISLSDFENEISANYHEIMINKAILDNEKQSITFGQVEEYAKDNNLTDNMYMAYKYLSESMVREILIRTTKVV